MLLNPYIWLAGLILLAGSFGAGWVKGEGHIKAQIAAEAAQHVEKVSDATDKVVVKYVDKIQTIPGPTVIKRVLVGRVCAGSGSGVQGSGGPAAAPAPDAGDRLADDLRACKANSEQLGALIEAVKANNQK